MEKDASDEMAEKVAGDETTEKDAIDHMWVDKGRYLAVRGQKKMQKQIDASDDLTEKHASDEGK